MPRPARRERPVYQVGDYWLSQRGNVGAWCRTWYDTTAQQVRRTSFGTEDLRAAKRALDDWFAENVRPTRAQRRHYLIEKALLHYYNDHASKLPSATQARIACAHLSNHYAGKSMATLTTKAQKGYVQARLDRGVAANTIRREVSVLKAALNHAFTNEEVESVPPIYMPPMAAKAPKGRTLTLDELARVLDDRMEPHVFTFAMVMLNTCCRPDAALDLTLDRCDFDSRLVTLNPEGRAQTKKHRPTVPMTDALRVHLLSLPGPYAVQWRGKRIRSIKTGIRRLRVRADLGPDFGAYSFRHTMGRELARRGVPDWEIKGMMGHSQGGMTDVYAPYRPEYLGKAREAIDALFGELDTKTERPLMRPAGVK